MKITPNRPSVREQEVLRVLVEVRRDPAASSHENIRREILAWAQRRSSKLPEDAWKGNEFTHSVPGRNIMGIRHRDESSDTWALRANDPDKTVAGRIWTTEATVAIDDRYERPILGVRLLVNTPEDNFNIEPHVPGFLRQIVANIGLISGGYNLEENAWRIVSCEDQDRLISMLEDQNRILPVIVATGQGKFDESIIDVDLLTRATIGLAHVVMISSNYTNKLLNTLGKLRSVSNGSIRIYMPGFEKNSEPYNHRLFLFNQLQNDQEKEQYSIKLRMIAAKESLLRIRLNDDIPSFSSLRNLTLKFKQKQRKQQNIIKSNKLKITQQRINVLEEEIKEREDWEQQLSDLYSKAEEIINALEEEIKEREDWEQQLSDLHSEAEDRAQSVESELHVSYCRIQSLIEKLKNNGQEIDDNINYPKSWSEFIDWCDEHLIGRLIISSAARRNLKNPEFQNVSLVARCLMWLATDYRYRRIHGGGSMLDFVIESGIKNSPCGGDAFTFEFRGEKLNADWHIKNGGNTHDPKRCLRIYYTWDSRSNQVVVANMPAHCKTAVS